MLIFWICLVYTVRFCVNVSVNAKHTRSAKEMLFLVWNSISYSMGIRKYPYSKSHPPTQLFPGPTFCTGACQDHSLITPFSATVMAFDAMMVVSTMLLGGVYGGWKGKFDNFGNFGDKITTIEIKSFPILKMGRALGLGCTAFTTWRCSRWMKLTVWVWDSAPNTHTIYY